MSYVGNLISRVRRHTFNTNPTLTDATAPATEGNVTAGLSDDYFLDYLNDAQKRAESLESQYHLRHYDQVSSVISLSSGTRAYSIPADAYNGSVVTMVEFSSTGQEQSYYALPFVPVHQISNSKAAHPSSYTVRNKQVYLDNFTSSSGSLRITYPRQLDQLDIRRATISTHTDSGTQITALTLSTTGDDVAALDAGDTLCVNDRDGSVTMYNLRYDSYDDATGILTLSGSAHTYDGGESITNGDFVTIGSYTTTHSKLKDLWERYLVKYATMEILAIEDSNTDFAQAQAVSAALAQEIIDNLSDGTEDIETPTILNSYYT